MTEFEILCAPYRGTELPTDPGGLGGVPLGYPVGPGSPHRVFQGLVLPLGHLSRPWHYGPMAQRRLEEGRFK